MARRVQDREAAEVRRARPVRHLYEGSVVNPPQQGDEALCGFVGVAPESPLGRVMRGVRPDHCVVCLDIARGKGYGV